MRIRIPIGLFLVLVLAGPAAAQTNLGVVGGALFPVGDFAETADISPYIGARYELQDVNALGKVATVSYLVYGGYAFLVNDADFDAALKAVGIDDNGGYFDLGLGARVYSKSNSLFVGVGAEWVNLSPAGAESSSNGFGLNASLGFATAVTSFRLELEGRGNIAFLEGDRHIESFLVLIGLGLPF